MADSISVLQLGDLKVAEVGTERTAEISESVTELNVQLSSRQPSSIIFKVYDPDFKMFNANYFQVRREVSYLGYKYEIASVTISRMPGTPDAVHVRCGSRAVQKLARDKGAFTWNGITAAEFARQKADEFGMQMFIQQSIQVDSITRIQSDERDESTWDVLQRLAADLEYVCFEAYNVLYFTSEDYLLERQPHISVNIGSGEDGADPEDPWYPYAFTVQTNDDDWAGSSLTVKLPRINAQGLRPGMGIQLLRGGAFTGTTPGAGGTFEARVPTRTHMVTDVKWPEGTNEPVSVNARTLKETGDTVADTSVGRGVIPFGSRNLQEGDTGSDVQRLQMALGMPENLQDGVFGKRTLSAVKAWQRENKLGTATTTQISEVDAADRSFFGELSQITTYDVDGIIDADDWGILLAAEPTVRRYTEWANVDMSAYAAAFTNSSTKTGSVSETEDTISPVAGDEVGNTGSDLDPADRKYFF